MKITIQDNSHGKTTNMNYNSTNQFMFKSKNDAIRLFRIKLKYANKNQKRIILVCDGVHWTILEV